MRRNRAVLAEKKAKLAAAQEMQAEATEEVERLPEPVEMATDDKMEEKVEYDVKTGLNKDGSCPAWMNQRKFKKTKSKLNAKLNKFTPNKYGIGPHKKVLRTNKKKATKK